MQSKTLTRLSNKCKQYLFVYLMSAMQRSLISPDDGFSCITFVVLYLISLQLTRIDAFDNHWIKSSVVQLFCLYPSMGPEVVWNSQVKKKKKKNPGDAVVAWENKRQSRQLKKENICRSPGKEEGSGLYRALGKTIHGINLEVPYVFE